MIKYPKDELIEGPLSPKTLKQELLTVESNSLGPVDLLDKKRDNTTNSEDVVKICRKGLASLE